MINWDDPRLVRLERAGRAAWVWDARAQRIIWATDEAAQIWGVEDAFLLIDQPFGADSPAAADLSLASDALAYTEGIEADIRLWHSGRKRTLHVMARLFARRESGDLVLFTPAERWSEQQAARAANPIGDLLGTFPLGLAVFSTSGRSLYANPACARILGTTGRLSFEDLMGSPRGAERLVRALLGAGSMRVTPVLMRGGSQMTLEIDAALIRDPVAGQSAFLVQIADISARRGRERHLADRFALLKSVLESATLGWAAFDDRLVLITLGGPEFEDTQAENAIGLAWREALPHLRIDPTPQIEAAIAGRREIQTRLAGPPERLLTLVPKWSADGDFSGCQLVLSAPSAATAGLAASAGTQALAEGMVALIAHDNFEIVHANDRAAQLFGAKSAGELIGLPFLELFKDDERRASRHYDELAGGAPRAAASALEARGLDGRALSVDAEFRIGKMNAKSVVLAALHDVTALMARTKAPEPAGEMPDLIEAAPFALALIDNKGLIKRVNTQASRLLAQEPSELAGRAFEDLLDKTDRTAFGIRRAAAASMEAGSAATLETRLHAHAQGEIAALLALRPAPDGEGFLVAIIDIDDYAQREQELRRALEQADALSAQKTAFLSSVSHEMRTPLNAIIGFSEIMRERRLGPIGNERYAGYIDDIHMSGEHLLSLVNDLLDMSKIEAGRYELVFAPVDIKAVVEQALRIIRPRADKRSVALAVEWQDVPQVMADERSLRQILLNLLSNAVKFTPSGGRVAVRASHGLIEGVKIEIVDTGVGMSAADLAAALEPYRQVHHAANDEPGTGLGLPLAKALIEANRAKFTIESTPGVGTRAVIVFPAAQVAEDLAQGG